MNNIKHRWPRALLSLLLVASLLMTTSFPALAAQATAADKLVQCDSGGNVTNHTAITGVNLPVVFDTNPQYAPLSVDAGIFSGGASVKELTGLTSSSLHISLGAVTNYESGKVYEIKYRAHYSVVGEGTEIVGGWQSTGLYFTTELMNSATVSAPIGGFDLHAPADVTATITWNDAKAVTDVKAGNTSIGTDNFSVSGNTLTIKKECLATQSVGSLALTVAFDQGDPAGLTVGVTDSTPTVTGVAVTPSTALVQKGNTQSFSAAVAGTNNPAQTVTWSVSGNSSNTTISNSGVLTVASDETVATLTVKATSTVNSAKSDTANVTVTTFVPPAPTVTGVTVTPSAITVLLGADQTFSAAVNGENNPSQSVTWSVSGNNSSNTTISNSGVLTVGANETATTLTIKATSTLESTKYGTATVTVSNPKSITGISMQALPAKVNYVAGQSLDITGATIKLSYSDSSSQIIAVQTSMVSGFDSAKTGSQNVTVTYQGKATTFGVNVIPAIINNEKKTATVDISNANMPSGVTSVSLSGDTSPQSGAGSGSFSVVQKLIDSNGSLGTLKNLIVYDLKLIDQNGNPIENFTGKVKVKILIPSGMSGTLRVYWYNPDAGTLTDMDATVEGNYLVFETTHFSNYAIAQLTTPANPPTGDNGSSPIWWLLTALPVAGGAALITKRKHFRFKRTI